MYFGTKLTLMSIKNFNNNFVWKWAMRSVRLQKWKILIFDSSLSLSLFFSPLLATPPQLNSKHIPFYRSPTFNWTGKQDLLRSGSGNFCLLCISTSKWMLVHAFTWSKTMKNFWKSWKKSFFFMSLKWASHTQNGKGTFSTIFACFSLFSTMRMHTPACVRWSKYATIALNY